MGKETIPETDTVDQRNMADSVELGLTVADKLIGSVTSAITANTGSNLAATYTAFRLLGRVLVGMADKVHETHSIIPPQFDEHASKEAVEELNDIIDGAAKEIFDEMTLIMTEEEG